MRNISPLERRFWSKVNRLDNYKCWEWVASKSIDGYGKFKIGGKKGRAIGAHRVAWELTNGLISQPERSPRILVCHRCDNPGCCNPSHLFLGTDQDNVNDRESKRRNKIPGFKGSDHGMAKLGDSQVREIFNSQITGRAASRQFNISEGMVSMIRNRKSWRHLDMAGA